MSDEERPCTCDYDPTDPMDQCYCAYVPTEKLRRVYPIIDYMAEEAEPEPASHDDKIVESLSAFLDRHDLLTPG